MSQTVNERQVFQGGVQVPALPSKPVSTDGTGNLVASARSAVTWATAPLVAGASENDNVTIGKIARAIKLLTDHPARVRAYSTAAYRTADAARAVGTDPTGDHGLLLEVVTTAALLSFDLAPAASLHNLDGPVTSTIYFAVTNQDTVTRVINVTLTVLLEEN